VILHTDRLDLVPLELPVIEALLAGDLERARSLTGLPIDEATFAEDGHVLRLRRDQLRADPTELPWLLRAVVERATGEVVGRIGFHAPPVDGTVEIGYSVAPAHRRRGVAVEAATALIGMARELGVRRCLGSFSPANDASRAVLGRLGFVHVGEQVDEIDGPEEVHALAL
jgi:[ribosomal protein S5]-alanine N-acetyltransferase